MLSLDSIDCQKGFPRVTLAFLFLFGPPIFDPLGLFLLSIVYLALSLPGSGHPKTSQHTQLVRLGETRTLIHGWWECKMVYCLHTAKIYICIYSLTIIPHLEEIKNGIVLD